MHKPQRPKSAKGRTRPSRYQRLFTSAPSAGTESSDGGKKFHSPVSKVKSNVVKNPVESLVKGDHNKVSTPNLPSVKRPPSSLSKYQKVLPKIACSSDKKNCSGDNEIKNKASQDPPRQANSVKKRAVATNCDVTKVADALAVMQINRVEIALKMPVTGERVQMKLRSDCKLRRVLEKVARKCRVPVEGVERGKVHICNRYHGKLEGLDRTLGELGVDRELFHVVLD